MKVRYRGSNDSRQRLLPCPFGAPAGFMRRKFRYRSARPPRMQLQSEAKHTRGE